jgi:membrane protein implicated in regulation of membrane protease activity
VALVGVVLNIEHDLKCFYIWCFTNAAFAIRTFYLGAYEMTFLFCIYWILAVVGVYRWKTNPSQSSLAEENEKLLQENAALRTNLQKALKDSISGGMENGQKEISK